MNVSGTIQPMFIYTKNSFKVDRFHLKSGTGLSPSFLLLPYGRGGQNGVEARKCTSWPSQRLFVWLITQLSWALQYNTHGQLTRFSKVGWILVLYLTVVGWVGGCSWQNSIQSNFPRVDWNFTLSMSVFTAPQIHQFSPRVNIGKWKLLWMSCQNGKKKWHGCLKR